MDFPPPQQPQQSQSFPKLSQCRLTVLQAAAILVMEERLGQSWYLPVTFIHQLRLPLYLRCVHTNSYSQKYSHSVTTQPSPSFGLTATFPANWIKVPQRAYNYGHKQFDFCRLEPILFSTKGSPGINLGDALRENHTRLNGRNDPILRGTSGVISCRLLVRSLHGFQHL